MTPAEYEWYTESLEEAYEKGRISQKEFLRRMFKLGYSNEAKLRRWMSEVDSRR